MKKKVIIFACIMTMAMAMTACGSSAPDASGASNSNTSGASNASGVEAQSESSAGKTIDVNALKTIGDVFSQVPADQFIGESITDGKVVCAFESEGITYRAIGILSDELSNEVMTIDTSTEEGKKKEKEMLKDVPVDTLENLNELVLTDDQIKGFIGKTGEELLQEKWTTTGSFMLDNKLVYMDYGPYTYAVTFTGESDLLKKILEDSTLLDDPEFDIAEVIKTMTVESIENPELSSSLLEVTE